MKTRAAGWRWQSNKTEGNWELLNQHWNAALRWWGDAEGERDRDRDGVVAGLASLVLESKV